MSVSRSARFPATRHFTLAALLVGSFSCADGCGCGAETNPALPSVETPSEADAFAPSVTADAAETSPAVQPTPAAEPETAEGSSDPAAVIHPANGTEGLRLRLQQNQLRPRTTRPGGAGDRSAPQLNRPRALELTLPGRSGGVGSEVLRP